MTGSTAGSSTGLDPSQLPEGLARFVNRGPPPPPGEQCEMCAVPIGEEHSHVVNLTERDLLCTCRACYLLFDRQGAAGGKYRAVPERYRYEPDFAISAAQWDELQIPVGLAFFFYNSTLEQTVSFYPSPAGATESLLPLQTWEDVMTTNGDAVHTEPDVEALLLRRITGPPGDGGDGSPDSAGNGGVRFECYLVPIDACYELVGRVRKHWRGFHGGEEVWQEIEDFFGRLQEHSRPLGKG